MTQDLDFQQIQWDARTKDGFAADEIAQLFGGPFLPKERRKSVFNELFCAEMIMRKLKVVYDSGEDIKAKLKAILTQNKFRS